MASRMKVRRSSIFLLELMITILLFAVNSAVCIRIFAEANRASQQAQLLTEATGLCTNAAEIVRAADSPAQIADMLEGQFGEGRREGGVLKFDRQNGSAVEISGSTPENQMYRVDIRYLKPNGDSVYELKVMKYFPEVIE